MYNNPKRVELKDVVAKQLPEFVRENYPTFVSFVEAYYEFLGKNQIEIRKVRDVDLTLDDFIQYFKKELAHNFPANVPNPRFLMKHVRDEYLAKGSEASYRLLFRLLYGKEIYMDYPGRSMLRVSDGRWKQDVSVFVRVDAGSPNDVVGKAVDVQTSRKVYRTEINPTTLKLTKVTVNVESAVLIDEEKNIWEIFLDRNFYGTISPGDVIKYGSSFQSLVLPTTAKLKIQNKGSDFKPGMIFQVSSGNGSPIWFKVTSVDDEGGLVNIDIIKFGLYYDTDFSITTLPSSAVRSTKKIERQISTITYSKILDTVGVINILTGGANYLVAPQVVIGGNGTGATAHAVVSGGVVTDIILDTQGEGYTTYFVNIVAQPGDTGSGATAEVITGDKYSYNTIDSTSGFNELGYVNYGDYWNYAYSDGAYVGTIARQFYLDAKDTLAGNPALINVTLDALAKYPGYYKSNDGFLDDAMFIQDSYYYQAFSYVIRIDEQLQSYAAAVRSMLHPSGMALFGEYSIDNKFDLSIALEVMIKSLGINIYDTVTINDDNRTLFVYKDLSDSVSAVLDSISSISFSKALDDTITESDALTHATTKSLTETITESESWIHTTTKGLTETIVESEIWTIVFTQSLTAETVVPSEVFTQQLDKYLEDTTIGTFTESGYLVKDPYEEGGYFLEIYANGRDSTF